VAELVLRGGVPAVRQAVDEQNARAREAGEPQVRAGALVTLAEGLLPRLRAAEWRDRAEAAAGDVDEIGLRDLRAVVAGSDAASRDDACRALLTTLREALERRIGLEQEAWLTEIRQSLAGGRVVRALRVSGRPPEPGVRFPAELAEELSRTAGAAMTPETTADRWVALLDAVVASPVRRTVAPQGLPSERAEDLERSLRLAAPRVPALQALLGGPLRPPAPRRPQPPGSDGRPRPARGDRPPRPPPRRRPAPRAGAAASALPSAAPAKGPTPEMPAPPANAPAPESTPESVAAASPQPPAEAPAAEAPPTGQPPSEQPPSEQPPTEQPPTGSAAVENRGLPADGEDTGTERSGDDGDDAVLVEELS